jgi:hypothetical protein
MVIDIFNDIKPPSINSKKTPAVSIDTNSLKIYDDRRSDNNSNDRTSDNEMSIIGDGKEIEGNRDQDGVFLGTVSLSGKSLMNFLLSRKMNTQWFDIEKDITIGDVNNSDFDENRGFNFPFISAINDPLISSPDLLALALPEEMEDVKGENTKAKKLGKLITGEIRLSGI